MFVEEGADRRWMCSPLEVTALCRDPQGENWGYLVLFRDPDGNDHELVLWSRSYVRTRRPVLDVSAMKVLNWDPA